jgi:hypothetical protein
MWPFGRTEVALSAEPLELAPGQTVRATASVGNPDRRVSGGRIELLYRNEHKYEGRDSDGDRTVYTRTRDVVVASEPLFGAGGVAAGDHTAELTVPAAAPGSAGDYVEWRVRAVVDRRSARDANAFVALTVHSSPDTHAAVAAEPPENRADVPLALEAAPRTVRPGDRIAGTLTIGPATAEVTGRAVRVQLKRTVHHQDDVVEGDEYARTALAQDLRLPAGERGTLPFELTVPPGVVPTFAAQYNRCHWHVEGVIDRPMRSDHVVRAQLNLHTG